MIRRLFRLQGHALDYSRLYAVQWVLGVFGIGWALAAGLFVFFGGANQLTGELYIPLVHTFGDYRAIGAALAFSGVLGIVGLGLDLRWVSIASATIGALWNGLLAAWVIPANWSVPGGGNLVGMYALFVTVFYLLRIILLLTKPTEEAMKLR